MILNVKSGSKCGNESNITNNSSKNFDNARQESESNGSNSSRSLSTPPQQPLIRLLPDSISNVPSNSTTIKGGGTTQRNTINQPIAKQSMVDAISTTTNNSNNNNRNVSQFKYVPPPVNRRSGIMSLHLPMQQASTNTAGNASAMNNMPSSTSLPTPSRARVPPNFVPNSGYTQSEVAYMRGNRYVIIYTCTSTNTK